MTKRSKSISLSDDLIDKIKKMLKAERRKLLNTTPVMNDSEMPSFSSFIETLLNEAIKARES